MPQIRQGVRTTLRTGPWKGVYATRDPFDVDPQYLTDARNIYIADPTGGSGIYARPGFTLTNGGTAVHSSATAFKGQNVFTHYGLDGEPTNFAAFGGKLYRADGGLNTYTDVTPVGVTISADRDVRVYFCDLGGVMCVNDGVNRPWVASNITSTPITGTYIDFDGVGTSWRAFGPPRVYGGSGFFVLYSVNGVAARIDIAWTEPNDWTTGYQQPDYDNRWTLEQTGTDPIYALAGTNVALYYWRQRSIGAIAGAVGINLATTATHDAISSNVGTEAPQTVIQFRDRVFFCDVMGRPWMFTIGEPPQDIWLQMRSIVDAANIAYTGVTSRVATAGFEPTLNLYCVAIWSPEPGSSASPVEFHTFDAQTGRYGGRWSIGPTATGVSVDAIGSFVDNSGHGQLIIQGSATSGGTTGYVWAMNGLVGVAPFLGTEDLDIIGTEDLDDISLEGQFAVWQDDEEVPLITATTDRIGYSADLLWLFDQATAITGTDAPVAVTATTPDAADANEGTVTPNSSADGMYRSVLGLNLPGRGVLVTVSPTTAEDQWNAQRIELVGVASAASPQDS